MNTLKFKNNLHKVVSVNLGNLALCLKTILCKIVQDRLWKDTMSPVINNDLFL